MKSFLSLSLLGLATAQSSVVSLFIPETGPQSLVASVIGNDASATTYSINCPRSEHECGMGPGMTYTGGLTTAVWTMKLPGEFTGVADCSVGKTLAVCTESMGGSGANFPGVSTVSFSDDALTHMPVTITAGNISSVSGASPATTTTTTPATPGAATTAAGAATVTDKTSVSGETGAASQTGSGTGTSTTASTGGLPAVTGNVGVVGGIAVAVAAAVL